MTVQEEIRAATQPGYEPSVALILERFETYLGPDAYVGAKTEDFFERTLAGLAEPGFDPEVRLQLIADCSSLLWWCRAKLGANGLGPLHGLVRQTLYELFRETSLRMEQADPATLTAHAVFVGRLLSPLHSPTRGSFDYVRALACDPDNRSIAVYHSGVLTPELEAYGSARLGDAAANVRYVSVETNPDYLADILDDGPCTFHFWCENPYAIQISLAALVGPTIMFTCAEVAPVQFADVYWYVQEQGYLRELWKRQGAPDAYAQNYCAVESYSYNPPTPLRKRVRAELGWSEDDQVIVTAGNRLSINMDQSFMEGVTGFVLGHPKARWVVVGGLPEHFLSALRQTLGLQFMHVPYDTDLMSLLELCDIFASPFREGGGAAAVMGIHAGAVLLVRSDIEMSAYVPPAHRAVGVEGYVAALQKLSDPAVRRIWLAEQQALQAQMQDDDKFAKELKRLSALAFERFSHRIAMSPEQLFGSSI